MLNFGDPSLCVSTSPSRNLRLQTDLFPLLKHLYSRIHVFICTIADLPSLVQLITQYWGMDPGECPHDVVLFWNIHECISRSWKAIDPPVAPDQYMDGPPTYLNAAKYCLAIGPGNNESWKPPGFYDKAFLSLTS